MVKILSHIEDSWVDNCSISDYSVFVTDLTNMYGSSVKNMPCAFQPEVNKLTYISHKHHKKRITLTDLNGDLRHNNNDDCFFSQMLNLNCNNINEDGMSHVVEILEEKKELEILL